MSNALAETQVELQKPPRIKPKQLAFLQMYYLPNSPTVGNVYQSAIGAGFRPSYARILTTTQITPQWLKDAKGYLKRTEPEHIRFVLEDVMYKSKADRDRLKAAELLGKDIGMFVDRSINTNLNISFTNNIPRPGNTPIEDKEKK